MSQIKIENVTFSYGNHKRNVLKNINFQAQGNSKIGIIGANGVGKSTLLKLLVGLIPYQQGAIEVAELPVNQKNITTIREKTGYVFQDSDSQLFMTTVGEDVAFGPINYGYSKTEVEERVHQALQMVHIDNLKDRHIYKMSGGEKKLASIATILALRPELMLLDEPSGTLDPKNRRNLIHILNQIDCMMLIASHDLDLILDTCDRTVLLSAGQIVADGKTLDILQDKALLDENGLELPLSLGRGLYT